MDYTATSRSDPPPTSRRTTRSTDSWRPRPTTTLRPVSRRGAGRVGVTKAAGHLGPLPQTVPGHRRNPARHEDLPQLGRARHHPARLSRPGHGQLRPGPRQPPCSRPRPRGAPIASHSTTHRRGGPMMSTDPYFPFRPRRVVARPVRAAEPGRARGAHQRPGDQLARGLGAQPRRRRGPPRCRQG